MPEDMPIDHQHLARYTMQNADLEREVLGLFAQQLPETLERLRTAATPKDWHAAAHTLKGSARAVGAWALAEGAAAAEQAGWDDAERRGHVEAIAREIDVAMAYVARLSEDHQQLETTADR